MIRIPPAYRRTLLLALLVGGMAPACQNSLDPIDISRSSYTIYGYLDLFAEVNHIRVHNFRTPLRTDSTREINARVTLENLDTGEMQVLEDSVVLFEGVYTHNFRTDMEIRSGETYRLAAEGPDGGKSVATTTAPPLSETSSRPSMPDCTTATVVSFDPVVSPSNLSVSIAFEYRGRKYWDTVSLQEGSHPSEAVFAFSPRNLMTNAFANLDADAPWCHQLSSDSLWVEYTHHSSDFYDPIDTDTLGIPGGAGRFGSLYKDSFSFAMDTSNVCFPFCDPVADNPAGIIP